MTIKRIGFCVISALVMMLAAAGCAPKDKSICYVNPDNWSEPATVVADNVATDVLLDVVFNVRCNADLNLRILPVVIRTIAPNGLECIEQAFWTFGENDGPAAVASLQRVCYRSTCLLDQVGEYKFVVSPREPVRGIEAVIVNVEPFK